MSGTGTCQLLIVNSLCFVGSRMQTSSNRSLTRCSWALTTYYGGRDLHSQQSDNQTDKLKSN